MMALVLTCQTREFLLHQLSYLRCHDAFELVLSAYNLASLLLLLFFFPIIFRVFAAQGQLLFIRSPNKPLGNYSIKQFSFHVHFFILGVTGVELTLLVAIFAIIPLLLVLFVETDFSCLAGGSEM